MSPKKTAFLIGILIFLAGMVAGVVLDHYGLNNTKWGRYAQFKKFMGPKRFDLIQERLQKKFTKELNLNSSQQEQLMEILKRNLQAMKTRAKQHDQEIEQMKEETRKEIFGILNPEQSKRFSEWVQKVKERHSRSRD